MDFKFKKNIYNIPVGTRVIQISSLFLLLCAFEFSTVNRIGKSVSRSRVFNDPNGQPFFSVDNFRSFQRHYYPRNRSRWETGFINTNEAQKRRRFHQGISFTWFIVLIMCVKLRQDPASQRDSWQNWDSARSLPLCKMRAALFLIPVAFLLPVVFPQPRIPQHQRERFPIRLWNRPNQLN